MTKILKSLWPAATVNFFYYAILGGLISYLAILLSSRGFSSVEIGQVFAIFTIARVITGQLWAYLSDRQHNPLLFFQLGIGLAIACLLPSLFYQDKLITFVSVVSALTCFMSVISQIEVLSLFAVNDEPVLYNRVRLFGSVGFILAAVFIGWQIDYSGPEMILIFAICVFILILLVSLKLDNATARGEDQALVADEPSFLSLCLAPGFIVFMLASILMQVSFAPYLGFFTKFLAENGYQGMSIGLLFSLGSVAEVALFVVAGHILARYNVRILLFACLFMTAIRWLAVGYLVSHWWAVVLTQLIHALSFGLMHSTSIYFIRRHFTAAQQNRGQFMYLGVTFGLGGALGAAITGVTWQGGEGSQFTYVWASACALLGALLIFMTPARNFQYNSNASRL